MKMNVAVERSEAQKRHAAWRAVWVAAVLSIMGVLGAEAVTRYVVKNNAGASYPYTTWATAAASIQQAVDACVDGDEVIVTNGVYDNGFGLTPEGPFYAGNIWRHQTNRVVILRNITVRSLNGPSVTSITGVKGGATNYFGAIRPVIMTNGVLSGFTVSGGRVWDWLRNVDDKRCQLTECGAGVCMVGRGIVTNCIIEGNGSSFGGGGIYGTGAVIVTHCTLRNNESSHGGGACFDRSLGDLLYDCLLYNNFAESGGGGIYMCNNAQLCTVVSNYTSATMTNAWNSGGGVSLVRMRNCVVISNVAPNLGFAHWNYNPNYTNQHPLTYTLTDPPAVGEGNISGDPRFVNFAGQNYRLQNDSTCLGRARIGDAQSTDRDLDFNPRVVAGADLGCYENQNTVVDITNANLTVIGFHGATNAVVGGNRTAAIVGGMWISNAQTGARVSFAGATWWVSAAIGLTWGKNELYVYGTNVYGGQAYDVVTVWKHTMDGGSQQSGSRHGKRVAGWLKGWGANAAGQTTCPAGNDYVAVAAGEQHSLALRSDGTLVGWGMNTSGQATVPPGTNYVAVAAGARHSLGLRSDGTIAGWGLNNYGQINVPQGSNYVAVTGGEQHSLALRSDGTLVGWGDHSSGQTNCPLGSNYVAVVAGGYYSLALRADGTVVGWGTNNHGQLNVPPGSNYIAIAAGMNHSLALRGDGKLVGWGSNFHGQTNCPPGNNYVAVGAGAFHSVAMRSDGTLVGWGSNYHGQTNRQAGVYELMTAGGYHNVAIGTEGTYPYVDVTNANRTVNFEVTAAFIGGTNGIGVVGGMRWDNSLGGSGNFAAPVPGVGWTQNVTGLQVGTNVITVTGTNMYGHSWIDSVTITRLAAGSGTPAVILTTTAHSVSYETTSRSVAGTNNPHVVGGMWVSNVTAGTRVNFAAPAYPAGWTSPALGLNVGANVFRVYGTNANGVVAYGGEVTITQLEPVSVESVMIGRTGDNSRVVISWSNAPTVVILAQTDQYYSAAGPWFVLASGVASPWVHEDASNYWAVYYRLVNGTATSAYDVAKYDTHVLAGSVAWIGFPLMPVPSCTSLYQWMGNSLELRKGSEPHCVLKRQQTIGGTGVKFEYMIDDDFLYDGGTGWYASVSGQEGISRGASYQLWLPGDHPAVVIRGVGVVPTNSFAVPVDYSTVPWLGYSAPWSVSMMASGLTNVLSPVLPNSGPIDVIKRQQVPGGTGLKVDYCIDEQLIYGGGTNFYPNVSGYDRIEADSGFQILFAPSRSGTNTWDVK